MTDRMDFIPLTLAEVGRNNDNGTTVLEEINAALQALGRACLSEATDGHAKLTVAIDIKRTPNNALQYTPTIKETTPGKRLVGALGLVDHQGRITTQTTDQPRLPFEARAKV